MIRFEAARVADKNHLDSIRGLADGRLSVGRWEGAEPGGIFNAWEWAIPSAIAFLILKPAFDAFLKELGTSAGKATIVALGDLLEYSKTKLNPRIYSSDELREVSANPQRQYELGKKLSLLSISLKLGDEPHTGAIKLIFASDCDRHSVVRGLGVLEDGALLSELARTQQSPHTVLVFKDEHWHLIEGPNLRRISYDVGRS